MNPMPEWNAYLEGLEDGNLATPAQPAGELRERNESCVTAPSVTNSVAMPATGCTEGTGIKNADTWKTVIVGLPIIRKLLNGEEVDLETLRVNLIPDDVLWNAREGKEGERSDQCAFWPAPAGKKG